MAPTDVLTITTPFRPAEAWLDDLKQKLPGLEVHVYPTGMSGKDLAQDLPEEVMKKTTVLYTWKAIPTIEQAPRLEYVQLHSAGCNQALNLPLFKNDNVSFCTANGVHPPQIAEWVFATFLGFQHHLQEHLNNQRASKWVDPESDEDVEDAVGLKMGILGYGCVGRQCARVASAIGMDVLAYTNRERATAESRAEDGFSEPGLGDPKGEIPSKWFHGKDQLHQFLGSDLDILVVTLPSTPATTKMIGKDEFAVLSKKRAFISNVGRGNVIDTDALIDALNAKQIRGAALDVTEPEPLPEESKLWKYDNVVITPHCAGNSNHFNERTFKILAKNLQRRAANGALINKVEKELGY